MTGLRIGWRVWRAVALGACLAACAGSAHALTDEEIFREFRFSLVNPGARALGMGGAYVAIADDGNAALANPAGLDSIHGPQIFVEFRVGNHDPRIYSSNLGSLEVDLATGERDLPYLGLTSVNATEDLQRPTVVGVAWPFRLGRQQRRLTLALTGETVLHQDLSLGAGQTATEARFAFEPFPNTVNNGAIEAYSVGTRVSGRSSTEIAYWSASASMEVHPDFSVGVTLSQASLDLAANTVTRVEDPLELFLDPSHPRLPADPGTDLFRTVIDDTDSDFAFALGLHWHPDSIFPGRSSPWEFGAVFRKGASFDVSESTLLNETPDETFSNRIVVPDRYCVGASYRFPEKWLVTLEVERIEYTDMLDGFRSGVNFLTSGRVADGGFDVDADASVEFDVDDGYVPRAGVEYVHAVGGNENRLLAFRAGYYRAPDSRIRMSQFNSEDPDVNATYLDAFRGGEDENHFTVGAGYRLRWCSFHLAGDIFSGGSQVVGSYSCRFK